MISSAFTLKQLEALIWVADLGSFRKAAAHLNTTQPNISSRIAGLEKTLGLSLMQRDTGSVQLTAKGAEIVAQARVVLQNADTLLNIAGRPDLHTDRIRLGVTELVAYTWLREFMRRVSNVFPNVSIELTVDLSRNLDKELASNTLDLAIQTAPFSVQTTGEIALGAYPFAWVAAPDIAAKPIDLYAQPILTHARGTVAYSELRDRLGDRANIVPSNALMSSLHMVLDGMGIAILPQVMAQEHITSGALVALPMDWRPTPLQFSARFQSDKASGTVQAAAQIAAEVATDHILHSTV